MSKVNFLVKIRHLSISFLISRYIKFVDMKDQGVISEIILVNLKQ